MAEIETVHNPDASRYEARIDGKLAGFAAYMEQGDVLVFHRTETDPEFAGQGVASEVVRFALEEVRSRGNRTVQPTCSFVRHWIAKHPEYADLVAAA